MSNRKALLIGINYFGTASELSGCINDVDNMRKVLIDCCDFKDSEITIMTDRLSSSEALTGLADTTKTPTKANILKAIDDLVKDATYNSRLFFHYSGHGGYVYDKSGDESDRRDETIYTVDEFEITDDEIKRRLVDPLPLGCKLTCIFDSCHSGTVLDLRYNHRIRVPSPTSVSFTTLEEKKYAQTRADVILLSGCMDSQTSADSFEEGSSQGAMTYGFRKVMQSLGRSNFTYWAFMKKLCSLLKKKGYTQTPQITSGRRIDISNALFKIV